MNLYSLADAKHTTVGRLIGSDKRHFTIRLPKWLAWIWRRETIEITEKSDALSSTEMTHWLAYYEIIEKQNKPKK
jgi:hypothetical protein